MYVWTQNNIVTNSKIYDSIVGILLSEENNTIIYNTIQNNVRAFSWASKTRATQPSPQTSLSTITTSKTTTFR